jgi:hypothetical protein
MGSAFSDEADGTSTAYTLPHRPGKDHGASLCLPHGEYGSGGMREVSPRMAQYRRKAVQLRE